MISTYKEEAVLQSKLLAKSLTSPYALLRGLYALHAVFHVLIWKHYQIIIEYIIKFILCSSWMALYGLSFRADHFYFLK